MGVVASGGILRPWVWGPVPGAALTELFSGLPNDSHIVQFFDKGRMEINDPGADKSDPFYVTNGRLAVELVSGQIQTGLDTFEDRSPAQIDLASDVDDPTAPTYFSFNGVVNLPGYRPSRASRVITPAQSSAPPLTGKATPNPGPQITLIMGLRSPTMKRKRATTFLMCSGHISTSKPVSCRMARWCRGPLFYPWFAVTGYPYLSHTGRM